MPIQEQRYLQRGERAYPIVPHRKIPPKKPKKTHGIEKKGAPKAIDFAHLVSLVHDINRPVVDGRDPRGGRDGNPSAPQLAGVSIPDGGDSLCRTPELNSTHC